MDEITTVCYGKYVLILRCNVLLPCAHLAFGVLRTDTMPEHRMNRNVGRRMPSSEMLRRVALVITNVTKELSASIIRVTRIGSVLRLLVTANAVSSLPILVSLIIDAIRSTETSVLTRATRPNIPEDGTLNSHCRENLKSYITLTGWTL
jgi:hypothetical protein